MSFHYELKWRPEQGKEYRFQAAYQANLLLMSHRMQMK